METVTIAEAWPRAGAYAEVADVFGDQVFRALRPFEVEVVPSHLVAKLRPSHS